MAVIIKGYRDPDTNEQKWWGIRDVTRLVPYKTSRDSMYFSIRALEKKGLVERGIAENRGGDWVVPLIPTHDAIDLLSPGPNRPIIYEDETSEIIDYVG